MNKLEDALATCTDEELGAAFRTALEFPLGFKVARRLMAHEPSGHANETPT